MRAEGGPSCPSSKMVFSSFFFHYIILTETILQQATPTIASRSDEVDENRPSALATPLLINNHPEPLKTSVRTRFHGLWASFDHPRISATYNLRHRAFVFVLEGCGLPLAATAYQQSHKPRN